MLKKTVEINRFKSFLFFTCFLACTISVGQNSVYQQIKKLPINDEQKIAKIDSLLQKNLKASEFDHLAKVSYRYANWLRKKKKIEKAINVLQFSIINYQGGTLDLQKKYYRLGLYLDLSGRLSDQALHAYKNIVSLKKENVYVADAHIRIAKKFFLKGDYYTSVNHFNLAEKIATNIKNHTVLVSSYNNSYNTYDAIKTDESRKKLLENLLKSDSISKKHDLPYLSRYTTKRALGSYFTNYETRDTTKGKLFLNEALLLALKKNDSSKIASIYSDIGLLYDTDNSKKAISYFKLSLNYCTEYNYYQKAIIYSNFGLNNAHLRNITLSINQQHQAISYLTGNDFKALNSIEQQEILKKHFTDNNLWIILSNLSESYLLSYEATKDKSDLENAIKYSLITDDLIDIYNNSIEEIGSKLVWRKKATEIYSRALRASFLANDFTSAFRFMEKNKALILYEESAIRKQKQALQLPERLINREFELKKSIQNLTDNAKIINSKNELVKFQDSLQKAYPNYSSKLEKYTPKPIAKIQEELESNQALLEYHVTVDTPFGIYPNQNKTYGILITKEKKHFFEIQNMDALKLDIDKHSVLSYKPLLKEEDKEDYKNISYHIYQQLFPKEIREDIKNKELIIIPDNYLTSISFESLVTSNNKERMDYLILQNQVSYQYSHTFHDKNQSKEKNGSLKLAAFAPVNFVDKKLGALQNSKTEVENIRTLFKGDTYTDKKATKQAFFNSLENSSILHLATHANANDSIVPWIAFSDGRVYLDELNFHQNNTSLVVLSACNTSAGKIEDGEGVMSLSRSFFYGNTQASVSSLWKADDKATTTIMSDFYKNLNDGQSKATALHNSKINYLNNHFGFELSPHYWASFILIGDIAPLPERDLIPYYLIGASLVILFVILYLRRRKK